jgi:hypothetical protein
MAHPLTATSGESFRWRRVRSLAGLVIYVALCVGLSLAFGAPIHSGVVLIIWVAFVGACVLTDRVNRPNWERVGFFALFWLAVVWSPILVERLGIRMGNAGFFAITILVLLVAMRRSRMFVTAS